MRILTLLVLFPFGAIANSSDYIDQLIIELHMDVIAPKMMKQYIEKSKAQTKKVAWPCLEKLANDSASIKAITHNVYTELFGQKGAKELVTYLRSDIGKNLELLTFKKITVEQFNNRMSADQRKVMNQINAKYFNPENQAKQKELFRSKGNILIRNTLKQCVKSG